MAAAIPEKKLHLLKRETRAFAALALTLADGSPQVTILWFDWDGKHLILNTARGRVKDKVMHKHPVVALLIMDPHNPNSYLQIRGHVVEESEEGAFDVICSLNEKYKGNFDFPKRPGEVRVTYKLLPEQVYAYGE